MHLKVSGGLISANCLCHPKTFACPFWQLGSADTSLGKKLGSNNASNYLFKFYYKKNLSNYVAF